MASMMKVILAVLMLAVLCVGQTSWYVRKTGDDANGGSSLTVRSSGSDGVTNGTNTLTSASALFVAGDVGHGICIDVAGVKTYRKVATFVSSTEITFSGATIASGTRTWKIGGPLLTLARALATVSSQGPVPVANGDTLYIGAGRYAETLTLASPWTTLTAETFIRGDVTGQYTGDAGIVEWTAYTSGDNAAPSGTNNLQGAEADFLTFQDIRVVTGTSANGGFNFNTTSTTGSTNLTFRRMIFIGGGNATQNLLVLRQPFMAAVNILVDSCYFHDGGAGLAVRFSNAAAGADFDCGITIQNCVFSCPQGITFGADGAANTFKPGGVDIRNCTALRGTLLQVLASNNHSTTVNSTVQNCKIYSGSSTGLDSQAGVAVTEDYNVFYASTPDANITDGANSIRNTYAPAFHTYEAFLWGFVPRPMGEPLAGSPLLGFGDGGGVPSTDFLGRPRPGGGASANKGVGALERGNAWTRNTGTVRTGTASIACTGPGVQDFEIPVTSGSVTFSVWMRYDSNYGAGTKPQLRIINGGEVGVTDGTATMTAAVNTWEQLSVAKTATASGYVTMRLVSSAAATGIAFADDQAVN